MRQSGDLLKKPGARPAVFLDRDGVLNVPEFRDGRSFAPRDVSGFQLYDDAAAAVRRLKSEGFVVVVVTNQPDVGAGLVNASELDAMNAILAAEVPVDHIEVCVETAEQAAESGSDLRKPRPGMLLKTSFELGLALDKSYMVGDRSGDIAAGVSAGCRACIFIDRGYTSEPVTLGHAATVYRLCEAVDWILAHERLHKQKLTEI